MLSLPDALGLEQTCNVVQVVVEHIHHGVILLAALVVACRRAREDVRSLRGALVIIVLHEVEAVQILLGHLL